MWLKTWFSTDIQFSKLPKSLLAMARSTVIRCNTIQYNTSYFATSECLWLNMTKHSKHLQHASARMCLRYITRNILPSTTQQHSWLSDGATSRKVAGSIPDGVNYIFHRHDPSGHTTALGSTQPPTEMSTRNIFLG